ncbi:Endoplasmic reticulum vesicle protein 25 [Smittium culicis]|uniref:Endoplasmic reticulum vesicle protein 25 n=1 Tax=Smittium culicis TaxID=133412 RepID=A0A1R1YST3_9FUNG|nr:Endoplasmic reticulum vesicle protein 25 [Smittium culicis]OMJ29947.1 Endoplasmic reticulum vesicle protein 25 [Smittium culicis]
MKLFAILASTSSLFAVTLGLKFDMLSLHKGQGASRCVSQWIPKDTPVRVNIMTNQNAPGQTLTANIFDDSVNNNKYTHHSALTNQKFSFITQAHANVIVCIDNVLQEGIPVSNQFAEITINMESGQSASDFQKLVVESELNPIEAELRRLESNLEDVQDFLNYLKTSEAKLRAMNEVANTRVSMFSLITIGVLVSIATSQVFYLRRFFKAKKLI